MSIVTSQPINQSNRTILETQSHIADESVRAARPTLIGLGTAVPALRQSNADLEDRMARLWGLDRETTARWRRINRGCGVRHRHGVRPVEQVMHLTTAERMRCYERDAPQLAGQAAACALDDAGVPADAVTDLVVVTCTGFTAPGVDVALVKQLGLTSDVRRTTVGFMGCFGAITGLRHAVGACAADPNAVALVVCVELCSLHLRHQTDADNLVASALFGDGAAAAVVTHDDHTIVDGYESSDGEASITTARGRAVLTMGRSQLLAHGERWMSWRITDTGFAMTLARDVPEALHHAIRAFVQSAGGMQDTLLVHPGGPAILDAIESGLGRMDDPGVGVSRAVLAEFGNMSSATVLFVLQRALAHDMTPPISLLAFGPGLTVESMRLVPHRLP